MDCDVREDMLRIQAKWGAPVCVLMCAVACGDTADQAEKDAEAKAKQVRSNAPADQRARYANLWQDGMTVKTADLNKDERPDQWTYRASGKIVRFERDLNFDGRVDIWQYPDLEGNVLEEEMDLDKDGKVDVMARYNADGVVEYKELAVEFSGKFTVFKFYDDRGELLRVEQDEDADGRIDRWDYYENRRRVRVGWDEDRDGVPDRFDNLP